MRRRPSRRADGDRGGFAALELTILLPFVIVMLMLVVAGGRVARGRQLVDQAAQAASRAGSLSITPGGAEQAAQAAAQQSLADAGVSCTSMTVTLDTSQFRPGGQVVAHVTCHADLAGLAMAGVPGSVTLDGASASPLETYRDLAGG
jgi:Flp pilus assembly protein TadG